MPCGLVYRQEFVNSMINFGLQQQLQLTHGMPHTKFVFNQE